MYKFKGPAKILSFSLLFFLLGSLLLFYIGEMFPAVLLLVFVIYYLVKHYRGGMFDRTYNENFPAISVGDIKKRITNSNNVVGVYVGTPGDLKMNDVVKNVISDFENSMKGVGVTLGTVLIILKLSDGSYKFKVLGHGVTNRIEKILDIARARGISVVDVTPTSMRTKSVFHSPIIVLGTLFIVLVYVAIFIFG